MEKSTAKNQTELETNICGMQRCCYIVTLYSGYASFYIKINKLIFDFEIFNCLFSYICITTDLAHMAYMSNVNYFVKKKKNEKTQTQTQYDPNITLHHRIKIIGSSVMLKIFQIN